MSRGRRISRIKFIPPAPEAEKKYLLDWDNQTLYHAPDEYPKLTGKNIFSKPDPMVLEVGCGTGEFLISLAETQSEKLFVGVEISRRSIYYAVNQAVEKNLQNIKFIKADIRLLYPLMQPNTWESVHLNYPDPNYSAGRRKHRIFTPEFLNACHGSLVNSGTISVVTDQKPFLIDMLELAEADPRFSKTHTERYREDVNLAEKTRFQKVWERFDCTVYQFELQKSSRK